MTVAALVFLVAALRSGVEKANSSVVPPAGWIAAAALIGVPSVLAAARSWVALLPTDVDRSRLLRAFYTTQLWRYLPAGGAAQVAGQIALARGSGVPTTTAALASPIGVLMLLVAAACLGATSILAGLDTVRFAWLAPLGLLSVVLLHRRVLEVFLTRARRWIRRLPEVDHLPGQAALIASFLWGAGALALQGVMLSLLLHPLAGVSPIAVISANAVAWALGLIALPAPAGLGVREATLVALLNGAAPTAALVGAALVQRLVLIVAEVVTVAAVLGPGGLIRRARRGR